MNKQVKINIKGKDYHCDIEILKLIERLSDKVELLEYNRDKAVEYLKENACYEEETKTFCYDLRYDDCDELLKILKGSEE